MRSEPAAESSPTARPTKAQGDGGPITRPIELPVMPPPPPQQAAASATSTTVASSVPGAASAPLAASRAGALVAQASGEIPSLAVAPPPPLLPRIESALPSVAPPAPPPSSAPRFAAAPPPLPAAASVPAASRAAVTPALSRAAAIATSKHGLPWLWIAVGAVGLLIVGALGLWFLFLVMRDRVPASSTATAAPTQASATALAAAPATVTILGTPWGEVESLRDAAGHEVALPAQRETPLVLPLPAGHYVATLRHPNAATPASCEVDAQSGQPATCRAELLPIEPLQYFKEAGWWK